MNLTTSEAVVVATGIGIIVAPIIAILASIGRQLLNEAFAAARNLVVQERGVTGDFAENVLFLFLRNNAKCYGIAEEVYSASMEHVRSKKKSGVVWFKKTNQSHALFIYKGVPILLTAGHQPVDGGVTLPTLWYVRGTLDWSKLLIDAGAFYDARLADASQENRRFKVVRHSGSGDKSEGGRLSSAPDSSNWGDQPVGLKDEDIGSPLHDAPLNYLSLGPSLQDVVKDAKFWHTHQSWYKDRGIAWRRGYLLYGRPGTGKTSLVRALCEELDVPIHIFDLSSMDNSDFTTAWASTRHDIPRAILLEDVDSVFEARRNVTKGSLTFDALLNAIDGIERENGLLLFITTNHLEHVDPALGVPGGDGRASRPGRIDVTLEVPNLDLQGRLKMARRIIKDETISIELSNLGDGDTAAQFQERCMARALKMLWAADEQKAA